MACLPLILWPGIDRLCFFAVYEMQCPLNIAEQRVTRSLKKMRKIVFAGLTGILLLLTGGCYEYVAVHPEKSDAQFYEDKAECEKKARDYSMERLEDWSSRDNSYSRDISYEEIDHSRRCMRNKGWDYIFRK